MKKRIFFAMLISAFAAGAFLVSCDDDDDSGCTCEEYDATLNIKVGSRKVDPGSFGATDCDALEYILDTHDPDLYYICE